MFHVLSQSLQSLVQFCTQGTVIQSMVWVRRAGIRHGDPFSPAIFPLWASAIIPVLQKLHVGLKVRMYADDLIGYLSCDAQVATEVVAFIVHFLREFGLYTGLRVNVGKSTIIVKGMELQAGITRLELSISSKVRYLGIMIGDSSPQEVYVKAIAVSFVTAQYLKDLDVTPSKKVHLQNIWILTPWIFPARVRYPTKEVIGQRLSILKWHWARTPGF